MAEPLRKFVSRAPRYVLRPEDRHIMRFSFEHTQGAGGIEQTILINLSETGVAFLVMPGSQPQIGDSIKVEIPIPSGDQFAWWGRVVRVQEYEPRQWFFGTDPFRENPRILVAVKFDELPDGHGKAIRRGIEQSFMRAVRDQQYRTWLYYRAMFMQNAVAITFYLLLTLTAIGVIYWFTLPDDKYDAKRGTPWGDRYKFW